MSPTISGPGGRIAGSPRANGLHRGMQAVSYLALALLGGCSGASHESASQVVATVDGEEVTASMLETQLAADPAADRRDPAVQRAAIDQLVTETMFAKRAEEMALDKTAATSRELARARRTVLANAFARTLASAEAPKQPEVARFYAEHPEIFAERRRYVISTIAIRSPQAAVAPYVAAFNGGAETQAQFAQRLRDGGVAAAPEQGAVTADQLPGTLARKLRMLKPGDRFTYRTGEIQNFAWIDGIEASPVPLSSARASIAAFLAEQRLNLAARSEIDRLRSSMKVAYGDVGRAVIARDETGAVPRPVGGQAVKPVDESIARGVAGL